MTGSSENRPHWGRFALEQGPEQAIYEALMEGLGYRHNQQPFVPAGAGRTHHRAATSGPAGAGRAAAHGAPSLAAGIVGAERPPACRRAEIAAGTRALYDPEGLAPVPRSPVQSPEVANLRCGRAGGAFPAQGAGVWPLGGIGVAVANDLRAGGRRQRRWFGTNRSGASEGLGPSTWCCLYFTHWTANRTHRTSRCTVVSRNCRVTRSAGRWRTNCYPVNRGARSTPPVVSRGCYT